MKILIVLRNFTVGGAEKQIMNIAKQLVARKFDVTLFSFNKKGEMIEQIPKNIKMAFLQYDGIWSMMTLIRVYFLIQTIKTVKPDLVYTRLEYAPVTIAGKITGTPTVITFVNDPKNQAKRWIKRVVQNFWRKVSTKLTNNLVANSHGVAKECQSFLNLKKKPIVIHNGTDISLVKDMALRQANHEWIQNRTIPLVVTVGRLVRPKGHQTLIDAFAILNKKMEVRLLIVGSGKLKNSLERQIKQLNLENSIQLVGLQANPYSIMAAADLYVSSSVSEGFSNTLLEAAVLGLPIVSTDHRFGANELIKDGQNGLLVPVGNPEAMAEAIERVLKNPILKQNLSAAIRKKGEEFGIEKMALKYEQLFGDVSKAFT